jgi:hypothetical protein
LHGYAVCKVRRYRERPLVERTFRRYAMKMVWSVAVLAILLAVAAGLPAWAGGNGAVDVDLLVGDYPSGGPPSEVVLPAMKVGEVLFNPTASGKMNITVNLKDGEPEMEYLVFAIPSGVWGGPSEGHEMTTNKQGNGTIHFQRDLPEDAEDEVTIKVIVRTSDRAYTYITLQHLIQLK